ncbi:MAG: sigma-70 family RNA polymerase sigma factor [Planctomycetota bacterium]|nr:sigma-70 family RNA polymerase sigma factor [Planctomycetota bacterium]
MENPENVHPEEELGAASWIRRLAHGLIADPAAAEDAVQDTWLAALRRSPHGGPLDATEAPRPWLARVVRNFARQQVRGEGNRAAREAEAARADAQPSAGELILRAERQRELVEVVLGLDDPYRTTILLRYYEGWAPARIAQQQGISGATVRSRIQRALEELRVRLDARHGGEREEWRRAFLPLAAPTLPVGTDPGVDASTLATGAQTMITGVKIAAAVGGALLVGAAGWQVVRWIDTGTDAAETRTEELVAVVPTAPEPTRADAAELERLQRSGVGLAAVEPAADARQPVVVPPAARIAGTLLDEADGAPLASFTLRVTDPAGGGETLTTDEEGRFRSRGAFPAGLVSFELVDDVHSGELVSLDEEQGHAPNPVVTRDLAGDGVPLELKVAAGPSFALSIHMPKNKKRKAQAKAGLEVAVETAVLRPYRWRDHHDLAWTPVHAGEPNWVRFGAAALELQGGPPWDLEVRDGNGLWAGNCCIEKLPGNLEPVRIELGPRAVLHGRVTTTDGRPLAKRDLVLHMGNEKEAEKSAKLGRPMAYRTHTDADGRYAFRWVHPGAYKLHVEIDGHLDFGRWVKLPAGTVSQDLAVAPLENRGSIHGHVVSQSGAFHGRVTVFLDREPGEKKVNVTRQSTHVLWHEEGGVWVGAFGFGALAPGEYRLGHFTPGFFAIAPEHQGVSVSPDGIGGSGGIELVVQDAGPQRDIVFRAVAAASGDPIEKLQVRFVLEDRLHEAGGPEGVATIEGVPAWKPFEWRVHAPGWQPVWGDDGAFAAADEVELRLEPGWGTSFFVTGRDGHGVEGATILADGAVLGTTDENGTLSVALPAKPERVKVLYQDLERGVSNLRDWMPVVNVRMTSQSQSKENLIKRKKAEKR